MEAAGDDAAAAVRMRAAVKWLSFGTAEERAEAAGEVGRLARSDEGRKRLLPELGVVPPLVSMLADARGGGAGARMAAAGALLELARGAHRSVVYLPVCCEFAICLSHPLFSFRLSVHASDANLFFEHHLRSVNRSEK